VICTVGTTANALVARLEAKKERGRLVTDPDMRLPGHANVWAVGDCAIVPNAYDGKPGPPTAQFAEREGCQCAQNIVRLIRSEPTRPFRFKALGAPAASAGARAWPSCSASSSRLRGLVALAQRLPRQDPVADPEDQSGLDWGWELVFPRDLSHFRPAQSDPVAQAHYAPGEVVFRAGSL
jgi:NADH dehydrogenase